MSDSDSTFVAAKRCSKCKTEKSIGEFSKNRSSNDGFMRLCRVCNATVSRLWVAANIDKKKAMDAAYYAANTERCNAKDAAWRSANTEKKIAYDIEYRAANLDRLKAYDAARRLEYPERNKATITAWRIANTEMLRIHAQNRRARECKVGGRLSKGLAEKLFKLQKGKCPCCKQPLGNDFELDHKMPLALNGTNTDDNMQLLRAKCNRQKHAKHPVDFMQEKGFLL